MRLCQIYTEENEPIPAFYYDDHVIPLPGLYEIHRHSAYSASPLLPPLSNNTLAYLPPNWPGYRQMFYLGQLSNNMPDELQLAIPLDEVPFALPTPMPNKLLCLAGNYADHIAESGAKAASKEDTFPFFFMKPPTTTVRASGTSVAIPLNSPDHIDWEAELVVVIGDYCKDISADEAKEFIAGYTIGLDMSNRQLRLNPDRKEQSRTAFHEWLCGKWHDGFAPIGPCIVAADDDFDPTNVEVKLTVNGKVMQKCNTDKMIFNVYEIVSYASKIMTLEPGDMIMTGTPSGVGDARGIYLHAGDEIEAIIEGIGTLQAQMV